MNLKKPKRELGILEIILIEAIEIILLTIFYYSFIKQEIKFF
jgi:hypothetical protein